MFRKILLLFTIALFSSLPSFANDLDEVETFFDNYVNAANSYSKSVANYYLPNAAIIRVVVKPDGTEQSVSFPMERYKKELSKGQTLARIARYKNTYVDRKYEKLEDGDYKISARRIASADKNNNGLPFHFIVTKTDDGWKVKEESMHTTVQKFLNAK